MVDFDQIYTETPLEHGKEIIRVWWPWPHFQGHTSTFFLNFDQTKACLHYLLNQMIDSGQTLCIVSLGN